MPLRQQTWLMLGLVATSTPLALFVETGLRRIMFPPEFDEVRAFLQPALTLPTWTLLGLVALMTLLGMRGQSRRVERRMAARPPEQRTPQAREKEHLDSLVLFTSLPQVPAILATFCYMFGAPLLPVVANLVAATLGVMLVGAVALRRP